jgi:AcrR family transcriptional regulator
MAQRTNLAKEILQKAGDLFQEQGYAATSIKQIANAAGCTTAALYYYYEGGKSHILREVIHSYRHQADLIESVRGANSLAEFLSKLTTALVEALPTISDQMNWLLVQFPNLPDGEKQLLQERVLGIQTSIRAEIGRFLEGETEADQLAWLVYSSFFGFSQFLVKMELRESVNLSLGDFGGYLARVINDGVR